VFRERSQNSQSGTPTVFGGTQPELPVGNTNGVWGNAAKTPSREHQRRLGNAARTPSREYQRRLGERSQNSESGTPTAFGGTQPELRVGNTNGVWGIAARTPSREYQRCLGDRSQNSRSGTPTAFGGTQPKLPVGNTNGVLSVSPRLARRRSAYLGSQQNSSNPVGVESIPPRRPPRELPLIRFNFPEGIKLPSSLQQETATRVLNCFHIIAISPSNAAHWQPSHQAAFLAPPLNTLSRPIQSRP